MPSKYVANLKGITEYIFRQGWGAPAHIITNIQDYLDALQSQFANELRVDTLCGKNLKYSTHEVYGSTIGKRNGSVRNACDDCFLQWEPENPVPKPELPRGDLPF